MVVYADILVAVNYFVSYLLLCVTERISGIPLGRRPKVLSALVGGFCALAVFLPLQGFVYGVTLRVLTAAAMLCTGWPGRPMGEYLRLGVILLGASFLFAGGVVAVGLLWPSSPVSCPGGMIYFRVSPLLLLVSVTICYLLLGLVKRFYSSGKTKQLVYRMTICHRGKTVTVDALKDTGNRLVEPFSGLPVAVCSLSGVSPLFSEEEREALSLSSPQEGLLPGFRLVAYNSVGGSGLLPAFGPEKIVVCNGAQSFDCLGWVAVDCGPVSQWKGIFNPDMLELRI